MVHFNNSPKSVDIYLPTRKNAQAEQNLKEYSSNENKKKVTLKKNLT